MLRVHILREETQETGPGLDWMSPERRIRRDMKMLLEWDMRVRWDERNNGSDIVLNELNSVDALRWNNIHHHVMLAFGELCCSGTNVFDCWHVQRHHVHFVHYSCSPLLADDWKTHEYRPFTITPTCTHTCSRHTRHWSPRTVTSNIEYLVSLLWFAGNREFEPIPVAPGILSSRLKCYI